MYLGDGYVDKNEFLQVCHHFGVAEPEAAMAFRKLGAQAVRQITKMLLNEILIFWFHRLTETNFLACGCNS